MKSKILLVVLMLAAFVGGLLIPRPTQISYVTREVGTPYPVEKVITQTIYLDREVIREVEKIVYQDKPVIPRWFTSEAELKAWLGTHQIGVEIPIPLIVTPDGVTLFNNNKTDCDDFTECLMNAALKDDYLIFPVPVYQGYVWNEFVNSGIGLGGMHIGDWTWIGNQFYYIEPEQQNRLTKLQTLRDLP